MKKLLLTFLIAFITALGLNATVTSPYKHTFASGELSAAAGKKTLDGVEWSWTDMKAYNFESANSKRGVQIGSKRAPQTEDWSISTTGISGTITAVKVNTSIASDGGATVKVSVGGTPFKIDGSESKSFTNTIPADYEFTGSASGEIKITMKASSKAMYLKSIQVTFSTGGGSTETTVLGDIMMGSTAVSTDEANPTATSVKGGGGNIVHQRKCCLHDSLSRWRSEYINRRISYHLDCPRSNR